MNYKNAWILSIAMLLVGILAAPALAGPIWKFGPEDQGLLKLDYKGQFRLSTRDTGSEPDGEGDTAEFNFRRNRLALMGAYGQHFGLYVQTSFQEDRNIGPLSVTDGDFSNFQILDAVMRFRYDNRMNFWLGKFKQVLTRENLEACYAPLTLDRSSFIRPPLSEEGTRDKGAEFWGNLFEDRFQYRVAVMNGRNDSVSSPESNFRYTARAHVTLLDPEKNHGYKGTYMGKKKVLTLGAGYQMENEIAFSDVTGQTGAVDYTGWTADLFFEYPVEEMGTFTVSGAYADYDLDDAYQGADPDVGVIGVNGEKNGGYAKVGYMLPEMPLQFFARGENWSFAELNGVNDQELDWYGAGFNYYFRGQNLKLTVEYSQADFDQEGADTEDFDSLVAQMQLTF